MSSFCTAPAGSATPTAESSYVLADHLAYCRFSYHEPYDQNRFLETSWLPLWDRPVLPAGVRLEMQPVAPERGGLSALGVNPIVELDALLVQPVCAVKVRVPSPAFVNPPLTEIGALIDEMDTKLDASLNPIAPAALVERANLFKERARLQSQLADV
jgi:hypothetical protein